MAALAAGTVAEVEVGAVVGWTDRDDVDAACASLVDGLVTDGLVERHGAGLLRLPR